MELLIIAFALSQIITYILVHFSKLHIKLTGDSVFSEPQKVHQNIVPRVGGISIYLSLVISGITAYCTLDSEIGILLLKLSISALPVFMGGLIEDLTKKVGINLRLVLSVVSSLLGIYILNILVTSIDIPAVDWLLNIWIFSVLITTLSITGLTNAYNIIDGFNGLSSMVGIITILGISYVALNADDLAISIVCLVIVGSIFGFFTLNYPRGMIFLGDSGAYLIGNLISLLSILLIIRNPNISPWFALLINIYPIFETIFTIWRRKVFRGTNPTLPDSNHFHSLIYRRLVGKRNLTGKSLQIRFQKKQPAPYLWLLTSLACFPAILWPYNTPILQFFSLLFCITYLAIYRSIIKFKAQKYLAKFKQRNIN